MENIEKIIEGIETIREFFGFGLPSQNKVFDAYQQILSDTLELLKEQEKRIDSLEYELAITKDNLRFYTCGND